MIRYVARVRQRALEATLSAWKVMCAEARLARGRAGGPALLDTLHMKH